MSAYMKIGRSQQFKLLSIDGALPPAPPGEPEKPSQFAEVADIRTVPRFTSGKVYKCAIIVTSGTDEIVYMFRARLALSSRVNRVMSRTGLDIFATGPVKHRIRVAQKPPESTSSLEPWTEPP